jgi:hypothetical protein
MRTVTQFVPNAASYHGICVRQRTRAYRRATIRQRVGLWSTTVGTSIFSQRFSWVSIYPTTRWHAALSSRAWALPTGTPTGARWLPTCVVCCADRRWSYLFAPSTVSRKPPDHQTPTGQCRVLASVASPGSRLGTSPRTSRTSRLSPGSLARLASLPDPTPLDQNCAFPNGGGDDGRASHVSSTRCSS